MAANKLNLDAVELDTSIQCRASIDTDAVSEYAERDDIERIAWRLGLSAAEAAECYPPERLRRLRLLGQRPLDGADALLAARERAEAAIGCSRCGRDSCAGDCAPSWRFLRPLTVAALYADLSLAEIRWLWDGMFPDGALILVASFQKEGKSTWLYALLAALIRGRAFLGRGTRSVRVLVLAVEEHKRDLLAHLRASGIGPDDNSVTVHCGSYPATPEALAELRCFVRQNRIELLVVDTLSRFWSLRNENDNSEVIEKGGPLLDLAHEDNVTVLLFHHTTDKTGSGASEFRHGREIRGASALFGLVDQAFVLARVKGQPATVRVLRSVGRYAETPAELLMDFDPETSTYRLIESADNPEEDRRQAREHKLLGYIAEHPGERRTEVQRGARVNRGEGFALLGRLISEGRIEERATGLYLPERLGSGGVGEPPEPGLKVPGSGRPLKGGRRNLTRTLGNLPEPEPREGS